MSSFACYKAINTKLHARKRILLNHADWHKMLDFKNVNQVIEFLKKKAGYSEMMLPRGSEEMHRGELEVVLYQYIALEIEKMLYYFSGPYKEFFKVLLMKYEINDLQLVLRTIAREEDRERIKEHFVHSKKHTEVDYDKLLSSRNVAQFVETLKGTVYYEMLKTMTQEDAIKREFHMEMKLNILFYKLLMEKANKLGEEDRQIVKEMIGIEIDCINIQWIYRATKYFDISREEILIYSLPGGKKISFSKLKQLIYAKSIEEFKNKAERYIGYSLFELGEDAFLEKAIDVLIYNKIKRVKDEDNIAMPLSYIYGMEIEVKELIAVTEGIRYGLPKEQIKRFLIYTT